MSLCHYITSVHTHLLLGTKKTFELFILIRNGPKMCVFLYIFEFWKFRNITVDTVCGPRERERERERERFWITVISSHGSVTWLSYKWVKKTPAHTIIYTRKLTIPVICTTRVHTQAQSELKSYVTAQTHNTHKRHLLKDKQSYCNQMLGKIKTK